jgi:hypothetical protein
MPVGGMIAGSIAEFAGAPAAVGVGAIFVTSLGLWVMGVAPRFSGGEIRELAKAPAEGARSLAPK